jgi:hypothetical protein
VQQSLAGYRIGHSQFAVSDAGKIGARSSRRERRSAGDVLDPGPERHPPDRAGRSAVVSIMIMNTRRPPQRRDGARASLRASEGWRREQGLVSFRSSTSAGVYQPRSEKRSGPNDRQGLVSFRRPFGSRRMTACADTPVCPRAQRHPPTAFQRCESGHLCGLCDRPNNGKETCVVRFALMVMRSRFSWSQLFLRR